MIPASLVRLHEAHNGHDAPALARWTLGIGVAATISANLASGLPFGPVGAIVSAWPALAFIGTVEMFVYLVRADRKRTRTRQAALEKPHLISVPRDVVVPEVDQRTRTRRAPAPGPLTAQ